MDIKHIKLLNTEDLQLLVSNVEKKSDLTYQKKLTAGYNIRKTYESVALMNADVASPIGTDGKYINIGDIVTVVNSTTPSENGIYSYEGATDGWKYQSSFNFQLSQLLGDDPNLTISQKTITEEINKFEKLSYYEMLAQKARMHNDLMQYSLKGNTLANDTGLIIENYPNRRVIFLSVKKNEVIELSTSTINLIHYYDSAFVQVSYTGSSNKITIPDNDSICFVGFAFDIAAEINITNTIYSYVGQSITTLENNIFQAGYSDSLNISNGKYAGINKLPFAEFDTLPVGEVTNNLTALYEKSTNPRLSKSMFATITNGTNESYYFIDVVLEGLTVGDKIKSGCFVFITSESASVSVLRYFTLIDPITTSIVIEANKLVFLEFETIVTESNINNTLRIGFYIGGNSGVQKLEMSGVYAYVNPVLEGYIPYYVYQEPVDENKVINDTVSYIEGDSQSNILPYCEFADETINATIDTSGLNITYAPATNPLYENSVFATKNTASQYWYFVNGRNLLNLNVGDTLQCGFWIKIKTSDNEPSSIRLYAGLVNTPNITQTIASETWFFVITTMDVTADNINNNFRLGYYLDANVTIESIEMTALFAYVNQNVGKYVPYYTTILTRAKRYTDEQLGNLSIKTNTAKGGNISRFLAKTWTKHTSWNDVYRQPTIKVSMVADSIGNSIESSIYKIENILSEQFPNVQFEYLHCNFGGMRAANMVTKVWEIINWNPDLVIYGEWEDYNQSWGDRHYLETIIRLFRDYTQADIALFAHSFRRESANLLVTGDVTGYLNSLSHKVRTTFMALAKKYNCEFMDLQQPQIEGLLNGTYQVNDLFLNATDVVHPSTLAISLWAGIMKQHFAPVWQHESYALATSYQQKTYFLQEAVTTPDIPQFKLTGIWTYLSDNCITPVADGASIELESENCCGWQMRYKGDTGKTFAIEIDGQKPSDIIPQYATYPTGNQFAKIQKVIVQGKVLTDGQFTRNFKMVVTSVTRNADNNNAVTGLIFDLVDVDNNTTIQSGCNAFADTSVNVGNGNIIIPYTYASSRNVIDSGYDVNYPEPPSNVIRVGDEYTFSIKKNYQDTVTIADGLISIFPLKRGKHSIKITAQAGAGIDSLMEL